MNGTRYSTPGRHSSPFKSPGRLRSRSDGLDFAPPQDSYQVPPPPGQGGMGYTTAPVAYNVAPMGPAMYPGPAMTYQGPPIQPQGLKPMVIEGSPIKLEPSVAYAPSAAVPMGTLGFGAAVPGSYLPGQGPLVNGYSSVTPSASVSRSVGTPAASVTRSASASVSRFDQPVGVYQNVEQVEGTSSPFSDKTFRVTTTTVMPPILVPPSQLETMSNAGSDKGDRRPLGELFVDRTSPDSLAPWLLLLEKRAPFVVHEIDPRQRDTFAIPTNPSGVLPMWVDADTSCVWGASTVMRFVCDKHHLSPGAYAVEDFHRKTKTNMAIDWCANVLKPHINQLVYPEQYDQTSVSSVENTKAVLQRDMQVLSDFFLRDATFIGGDAPDISDCYICMQLLLLYSTDFPPQNQVRQYLHATADKCDNWNEVTSGLREYCALRQRELAQWVVEQAEKKRLRAMPPPGPSEREIGMREEQIRREIEVKCRSDVAEWKQRMEEEIKRRDQDDARRRELEDKEWRADAMRRRAEMEEAIRKEEEQWKSRLIDQVSVQREEEDRRWARELEAKKQELQELEARIEDEARRREEQAREAEARRLREDEESRSLNSSRSRSRTPTRSSSGSVTVLKPRGSPQVGVEIKMLDDPDGAADSVVVVHSVVPNTPAAKAGLKMDDIIQSWDGVALHSKAEWVEQVKGSRIGSTVHLTVVRNGLQMEVPITIGNSSRELGGVRKVASRSSISTARSAGSSARSRSTGRK
mmetsp:Transcript_47785/g.80245  ORF Transcript_47785/g.80245 Transcript_47785/m.80245 type:complete len:748 (-) Transcript_47785:608-2851(-)